MKKPPQKKLDIKSAFIIILFVLISIIKIFSMLGDLNLVFLRRLLDNLNILWLYDVAFVAALLFLAAFVVFVIIRHIRNRGKKKKDEI